MTRRTGVRRGPLAAALVVSIAVAGFSHAASAQPTTQPTDLGDTEDDSSSLPWRGTSLTFSQSLNVNAFARSAQTSYNPTYAWTFILEPRWYFRKKTYANIDQRVYLELTDSDTTLVARRTMLSDTVLGVDTELWSMSDRRFGDLAFTGGAHLIAPTSLASRAATMTIGTRLRTGASMNFKHVMNGLGVAVQGRWSHRFLRHNTLEADSPFPCLSGGSETPNCEFLGSTSNARDGLAAIVSGSLELSSLFSLEALIWLSWTRDAPLAPYQSTLETGYVVNLPDQSLTHWHNERYLVVGGNWNATDWLLVGLSLIDYFPERNPDGTLRGIGNPLDLMIGLSTTIAFDKLYLHAAGRTPRPEHAQLWLRR
jgi:hypothetical protein